jgi:hypothetical protein
MLSLTRFLFVSVIISIHTGCSSPDIHKNLHFGENNGAPQFGGFWEGYSSLVPSNYYGFTFIEYNGELIGTCFQGGKDGVRLYYLEKCTIHGDRFQGQKIYSPWGLRDSVEGVFHGNTCRFVEYYTDGYSEITVHRVDKLSRVPEVFFEHSRSQ